MTNRSTFFPRLLNDEFVVSNTKTVMESIQSVPGLLDLIESFEDVTGWSLSYHELPKQHVSHAASNNRVSLKINDMSEKAQANEPVLHRAKCDKLAAAIEQMLEQLHGSQDQLRSQSAQLATAIPVVRKPEMAPMADLLETLLCSAGQLINAQAAGIYLLDESTANLNLRVSVGLPADRLANPQRPLKLAAGDLEALVGNAVIVKDAQAVAHWNIPEDFSMAVCLPIATAEVPLGTMWLFSNEMRPVTKQDTDILEIIAGRIAAELEKEAILYSTQETPSEFDLNTIIDKIDMNDDPGTDRLLRDIVTLGNDSPTPTEETIYRHDNKPTPQTLKEVQDLIDSIDSDLTTSDQKTTRRFELNENNSGDVFESKIEPVAIPFSQQDVAQAVRWQKRTKPTMMPMLDGWQIGGKHLSERTLNSAFHCWQVLPDSRIAIFVGDSSGASLEAALTAASLRTSVKTLANQLLSPAAIVEHVSEILWHDEMGDQFISFFCGMLDPTTGVLQYCNAGNVGATVFGGYVERNILESTEPIGTDIDAVFKNEQHILLPNQSLCVYNDGLRQLCPTKRIDFEDEGLFQILTEANADDLESFSEWTDARFANRGIRRSDPADVTFALVKRLENGS